MYHLTLFIKIIANIIDLTRVNLSKPLGLVLGNREIRIGIIENEELTQQEKYKNSLGSVLGSKEIRIKNIKNQE